VSEGLLPPPFPSHPRYSTSPTPTACSGPGYTPRLGVLLAGLSVLPSLRVPRPTLPRLSTLGRWSRSPR
jgi:hypothetical protein